MPAQQSTQREARRERLPATRVDQESRRLLLARRSGSSPPARRDLHAICHDVARSRGVSGSAINVCDVRSATEARGAREPNSSKRPGQRSIRTRSADAICKTCARARSAADSMCTPNERRCSNAHAHVSRARSTKSTEACVDGRDHCEKRGAAHGILLFWWRENSWHGAASPESRAFCYCF